MNQIIPQIVAAQCPKMDMHPKFFEIPKVCPYCGEDTEIEKEIRINPNDIDNTIYIIENVMHFTVVESYERYRTIFENNDIEIAVDEYPFGICIEIENKSIDKDPFKVVRYWTNLIGLNIDNAYRLSWDDKYEELCHEQGIDCYKEVTFDKPMPEVNNLFD